MTVWEWLLDPEHWTGPAGVPARVVEQLVITGLAVGLAAAIALPIGIVTGHLHRWSGLVTSIANLGRAIPTFALLLLFAASGGIGVGVTAAVLALTVFAIPPMLTNANIGVASVEPAVRRSAVAMGMTGGQVLGRIELPLGLPLIFAGVRTAAVQTTATATIAAFVGGGGLGRLILDGFGLQDPAMVMAGVILIAVVTMVMEATLAMAQALISRTLAGRGEGVRLSDRLVAVFRSADA